MKLKKSREVWVREWLQKRKEKGCTENLVKELDLQMPALFTNFLRLSKDNFKLLMGFVAPMIARNDTVLREAISARERLMITMRYLATGETFKSLSYIFRVSQPCISSIVLETCDAIYKSLKDRHMKVMAFDFIYLFAFNFMHISLFVLISFHHLLANGRRFQTISINIGIFHIVWELLMGSMLLFRHQLMPEALTTIIKTSTVLFSWESAMPIID